ncbi:hypothetical protein BCU30_018325 [Vibrio lentus]|uniref:hypothetical protein n=1 Tax=Vibrio lentus TaxID=136468 RepID=UPI000C853033|nr:hypothetical protein [Vibrio lentus]PMG25373.1 hypothetical protein BCU96_00010 [Vibrio lentus]PMH16765.1 hypothetical protein BCU76_00010 [Vibrio lentus]PMJ07125.1 hypothetical protein BCU30_11905 [Vibrio lentus]PMK87426.1 hypothetical protein BCT89_04545 [Vibrio lentus]PML48209.1 hypothetical protein BCT75_20675 [Vibrio lentus]
MYEFSKMVREVFLENKENIDLPFFYSFPKNSCESASYFLAALLAQKFPDKEFLVVHGYKHSSDEHHYWVEVDGRVIDITADQFNKVREPIYGADSHPLEGKFVPDSKIEAIQGIKRFELVELERKKAVLGHISALIEQRT